MISERRAYSLVNLILVGLISLIFIYSGIFSYEKANHPIPSFHNSVAGEETLSTGLSRSFSAIVRLEFDIAHQFNPYSIQVFLFFVGQFVLRIVLSILTARSIIRLKYLVVFDVVVFIVLFIIHLRPFIFDISN